MWLLIIVRNCQPFLLIFASPSTMYYIYFVVQYFNWAMHSSSLLSNRQVAICFFWFEEVYQLQKHVMVFSCINYEFIQLIAFIQLFVHIQTNLIPLYGKLAE